MKDKGSKIISVFGEEILDSRGNPTVRCEVRLEDGSLGVAAVPSGASCGSYEARELRDENKERYGGKGVLGATHMINQEISPALEGKYACEQAAIDHALVDLDGTERKERLGANSILAVSLAVASAAASHHRCELYRYLGGVAARRTPTPMMNVLNGGLHASNNLEIQEFMIVPQGLAFCESLRIGAEIYRTLGGILKKRGYSVTVGDEGGFAPDLRSDEEALELLCEAIEAAGYGTEQVGLALDVASSEWWDGKGYKLTKSGDKKSSAELIEYYATLAEKYPLISIEDGLGEDDASGWQELTRRLGNKIMLVGDDLFVTNRERLSAGIDGKYANAVLVKPNQIGTLTEVFDVIRKAADSGYDYIISHRSGETEDTFIADLAVATNARYIKCGAPCRSERTAKYNRLLRIEQMLGCGAVHGDR